MKRKISIYSLLLVTFWISGVIFLTGCKKDPVLATLTSTEVSEITVSTAKTGGNITANGGAEVTSRGVCWGTTSQPDIIGLHTSEGKGDGVFESNLTGLTPGTTYYIRAFASNEAGTAYGNEISFITIQLALPVLTTTEITGITSSSAVTGGNITSDGGAQVTEKGVCWSTSANPTIANNKTSNGTGSGSFTANISGLNHATIYHVRAFATNSVGTAYGEDLSFTTLAVTPTLSTTTIFPVTRTTAVSGGNITNDGGAAVTARGVCWSTSASPTVGGLHTTDGSGSGVFTSNMTGLNPNTLYYVRAYATNSAGTSYGSERSFTTNPVTEPTLITASVTGVTVSTAISGGNITEDNGAEITDRGVCWNTSGNPTVANSKTSNGPGTGSFVSNMSGLAEGTIYYVRAFATNSAGTGYGNQIRFSTSASDIDGNVYRTIIIGTQLWMQSDLKTTKFNDNSSIPNVTLAADWMSLSSPGYCWYDNNPSYGSTYGILYNWFTVETGRLCPSGWDVPTDIEFKTLEIFLGMSPTDADGTLWRGTDQGTQLKYTSTWFPVNGNGTNSSGFSALGGGYRFGVDGSFNNLGSVSYWWSSTLHWSDTTKALYRRLDTDKTGVYREGVIKAGGKFVRCLKN